MSKLIVQLDSHGDTYFYVESDAHHKKVEPQRRNYKRLSFMDLSHECLISKGEYLVVDMGEDRTAKSMVTDLLDGKYGKVWVSKGRGTGSSWTKIRTQHSVPGEVQNLVERQLVKHELVSTWWPDMSNVPCACVNWELK